MNKKYTVIDLFAGAGGLSKAFLEAGADIIWANELDKNACDLYRENFNNVYLVEGDIQKIRDEDIPEFDLLVGGFPCQLFSIAEKNRRFADLRNTLFYEIIRIIKAKTPRGFLLDNVKGLMTHDSGRTLKIVMEELQNVGYYIKSANLNSKEYGNIPHNKERTYLVGFREKSEFEKFEFPSQIQLSNKVNDIINIHEAKDDLFYYSKNIDILKEIKGNEIKEGLIYQLRYNKNGKNIVSESHICPALTLYDIYIPMIKDDLGIRKLTPNECFNFQGFHDIKIPFNSNGNKWYRYASNCSSVAVTERIAKNILFALDYKVQDIELENLIQKININPEPQAVSDIENDNELTSANSSVKEVLEQSSTETVEKKETKTVIVKESSSNNEKDFTINIVIPALKKKGFFDVRYNHGSDEYGKDITYKYKDNFGTVKCGAAQVKFGDISGGVQGEINTILTQMDDAFNMPFMDIKENKELYIKQLLIICSGKYTKNAQEKIIYKTKKGYDIRFFDGQDIDNILD